MLWDALVDLEPGESNPSQRADHKAGGRISKNQGNMHNIESEGRRTSTDSLSHSSGDEEEGSVFTDPTQPSSLAGLPHNHSTMLHLSSHVEAAQATTCNSLSGTGGNTVTHLEGRGSHDCMMFTLTTAHKSSVSLSPCLPLPYLF